MNKMKLYKIVVFIFILSLFPHKLFSEIKISARNMIIVAISLGLGIGIWQVDQLGKLAKFGPIPSSSFVDWSIPLFVSGIVVSGLVAAILNATMPEDDESA